MIDTENSYDLAIVGSGIAGLFAALSAAAEGGRVLVLSKAPVGASSSYLAQGGVAAATRPDDSPRAHAEDTMRAGRRLSRLSAVQILAEEAPARIADLVELGVDFDDDLGLEGGHSCPRVFSVDGAATGQRIARVLADAVMAEPRIEISEGELALELWLSGGRCTGIVSNRRAVPARAVVLATGGAAALWQRTTNPPGAVGEGIALAFRAGAAVADLEFVQFHPTALAGSSLLLSEALRGAGALLVDEEGQRFTNELAPRDVVARAIGSRGTALLDLRPIDRARFPSLMRRLAEAGYRPEDEPLPVSPAAHYTMGGIVTGLDGLTEVPGLYAAGECACTGLHGANRLASNSMLECLVFGRRAALAAAAEPAVPSRLEPAPRPVTGPPVTAELREAMWSDAGLVRDAPGLERLTRLHHPVVQLVARSALARRESRGAQFRADFPHADPALDGLHTVLRPGREPSFESWS
ncbi:MAG TPA: FAD-dependent oxidoreductase [Gaiellaceae bacterium]|nr:FAD-dependent oxidoreductase [Gaiellaceae bacterium]